MTLSKLHRLLKKSRPLSRSAQQRKVTLEALEDRKVLSFAPPVIFPVGVDPRAVTVGDFNNDGKPDLAVVNQGPLSTSTPQDSVSVLLGNGDGSFKTAITTNVLNGGLGNGNAQSVVVGDFNGDHLPDVALNTTGSAGNAVEVMLGKGDGSFQPNHLILGVGQTALSVAAGDFDHNGALDLVTANSTDGTISLLLNNGNGTFRPRIDLAVGGAPRAVAVGDFNGDGRVDVATAQQLTDSVSVLLGNGDGTFARPQVFAASGQNFTPSSLVVSDINRDGRPDLVIKSISALDSDAFQVGVLLGKGDGTFQSPILAPAQPDGSGDLALGDFNNDGRLDAAVAGQLGNPTGDLSVFFGNGDGSFQPTIRLDLETGGDDPVGVAAADLNGDGLVDLVATNVGSGTVGVLLNNSTGTTATKTFTTLSTSTATAVSGQPVTLTTTVTSGAGVPTGTVTFLEGTTVLGTARIGNAGQASIRVNLGVGSHDLIASFAGTGNFTDSLGLASLTVNRASTTLGLSSSVNPAVAGQAVTFTATVGIVAPGAGVPTGTVTFRDGNLVVLGTAPVARDGTATFTTSFAAAGSHVINAAYNGDSNFEFSRQGLTEQVNATTRQTTTSLLSSANPATVGQTVTFTAVVRDPSGTGTPTGTVTFFVGNTAVARVTLDATGQARIRGSFSIAGRFTIRAVYSGNATFDASEQSLTETVNAPTHKTTSVPTSTNPAGARQAVIFTPVHPGPAHRPAPSRSSSNRQVNR